MDQVAQSKEKVDRSNSLWVQEYRDLENEHRALLHKYNELKEKLQPERTKRSYNGPKDPETNRTIVKCISCGRYAPVKGRGMCNACYMSWYRSQKRRVESLGSEDPKVT
jgi:hypothetical protein